MEYTVSEIIEKLGGLINKAQKIRDKISADMGRGDARHVCLGGIQTNIEPLMLSYGAIECSNQCIKDIDLNRVCGIKGRTNKEILDNFDTWAKTSLLVFIHFKIENFFSNILIAIDDAYKEIRFSKMTDDLFNKLTITNKEEKKDCLEAMSVLRNSLHNNSINRNSDFNKVIKGTNFKFVKGEHTTGTIHDLIFLIDYSLDIIKEICESPEVARLPAPIPDLFHVKLGYL